MTKAPRDLLLQQRDESYGGTGYVAAFRIYQEIETEAQRRVLHRAFKQAGFRIDHRRCSWVSADPKAFDNLKPLLVEAGYAVRGLWD